VEKPRPFVRSGDYFGPDRRRRDMPGYKGPFRRKDDPGFDPNTTVETAEI
jgi:hypothetical protein